MITRDTRLYCVIGDPVVHSLSPFIMNRAFAQSGYDGHYVALRVRPDNLGGMLVGLRELGAAGANVTYPLKAAVMELADDVTPSARDIGAANWLEFRTGTVFADNTDATGTVLALEALGGIEPRGIDVWIFGAGGAARAAAWGLLDAGARRVTLAVRRPEVALPAVQPLRRRFGEAAVEVEPWTPGSSARPAMGGADVVINATPLGMAGHTEATVLPTIDIAEVEACYFDFVYHPRETPWLATARKRGARTLDGLALLVAQARLGCERWTGFSFAVDDMYQAAASELARRRD